jgi:hypothetical protein
LTIGCGTRREEKESYGALQEEVDREKAKMSSAGPEENGWIDAVYEDGM